MENMTVDYNITLEQMITAGKYEWTNDNITDKLFPLSGTGRMTFQPKLFQFNRDISSEDAIREMEKDGFRPAKIEELLTYSAILPEEQRNYPTVALGSVAELDGRRRVPCLIRSASERNLYLFWWNHDWSGYFRFLGVRK